MGRGDAVEGSKGTVGRGRQVEHALEHVLGRQAGRRLLRRVDLPTWHRGVKGGWHMRGRQVHKHEG